MAIALPRSAPGKYKQHGKQHKGAVARPGRAKDQAQYDQQNGENAAQQGHAEANDAQQVARQGGQAFGAHQRIGPRQIELQAVDRSHHAPAKHAIRASASSRSAACSST